MDPLANHQRTVQQTQEALRRTHSTDEQQRRFRAQVTMAGGTRAVDPERRGRVLAVVVMALIVIVAAFVAFVAIALMDTM